jgi:tellurite resistance protein TerC
MISSELMYFSVFVIFIIGILMFDLKFIGRHSHIISFKEAASWSVVWISFALLFYVFLMFFGEKLHGITEFTHLKEIVDKYNPTLKLVDGDLAASLDIYRSSLAIQFITGYLIEYTLSVDNIFVILMILTAFSVKQKDYKTVLFWGILGAIVLRCIFIFVGSALVVKFHWVLYIFGAFLIYSGGHMFINRNDEEKIEPQNHWLVKYFSKHFNVFPRYVSDRFFVKKNAKLFMTPLFIVLILIEFTDLIFALDSIPAIFAVSIDPYIVFFSNIFAIIGLRSLFFMLMKIIHKFHYLKAGVALLLVYVGIKLVAADFLHKIGFETVYSLYIIAAILVGSVILSVMFPKKETVSN